MIVDLELKARGVRRRTQLVVDISAHKTDFPRHGDRLLGLRDDGLLLNIILIAAIKVNLSWYQSERLFKSGDFIGRERVDELVQLVLLAPHELLVMSLVQFASNTLMVLDRRWQIGRSNNLLFLVHLDVLIAG